MRKLTLILLTIVFSIGFVNAQEKKQAKIEFDTIEHDFGQVKESTETVSYKFKIKNTGTAPLIIQRVVSTCSTCSASEYPQKPILPNQEDIITVTYKTKGNVGIFRKKITVFANTEGKPTQLTVKGEVLK